METMPGQSGFRLAASRYGGLPNCAAMAEKFGKAVAEETSILYGGSCNAKNAPELFAQPDIDGGLIGGASLKAEDFLGIITAY